MRVLTRSLIWAFSLFLLFAATGSMAAPDGSGENYQVNDLDTIFDDGFEVKFAIEEIASVAIYLGENFSYDVQISPPETVITQFELPVAPNGLTIDANGSLDWTPQAADIGDHLVTVRARDSVGFRDIESFILSVLQEGSRPLIEPVDDPFVIVGDVLGLTVIANDPDIGDVLQFSLDDGPDGLSIDSGNGAITWPTDAGDLGQHSVKVRVTDSIGLFDLDSFAVNVIDGNTPPVLQPVVDQGALLDTPFSLALNASDGDGDALQFSFMEAPPGMSIDPDTGVISWVPFSLTQGIWSATVHVSDGRGGSDSASFSILVDNNVPPVAVDDAYAVQRGETLTVPTPGILGNDNDPNQTPITAVLEQDVNKGLLSLDPTGSFEYTPDVPTSPLGFDLKYSVPSPGGGGQGGPRVADVDNDGITDIVMRHGNRGSVIRGDTGEIIYPMPIYDPSLSTQQGLLLADIDLDGHIEMIAMGAENGRTTSQAGLKLIALEHDGSFKWISDALPTRGIFEDVPVNVLGFYNGDPTAADLDQDGTPEIIVGHAQPGAIGVSAFDNQGRHLFTRFARGVNTPSSVSFTVEVADLDLDGDPEILVASAVFSHLGEVLWVTSGVDNKQLRSTPIVANLDNDPYPELVRNGDPNGGSEEEGVMALNHDGSLLWHTHGLYERAIPLVIADVDDDGLADVINVAANTFREGAVVVLNGIDGSVKWQYPAVLTSDFDIDYFGPMVLDFDRDGEKEVAVIDEDYMVHLLKGSDGSLIQTFDLGIHNYAGAPDFGVPILADIDQDGASELIITGFKGFGASDVVSVYQGPNDDWPATRPIWNQFNYHVTNINPDGTVPRFEQPHWLLPGLNQNRVNGLLPSERVSEFDTFTYHAFDGELQSNTAAVSIEILPPNNPPQILSTPRVLASPGFEYLYPVLAVDPDVGETLTFVLVEAPAGMSIDLLGQITWTPGAGDLGEHDVILQVTDTIGFSDTQIFKVEVRAATVVPNVVGLTQSGAESTISSADLSTNPVIEIFHDTAPAGQVITQVPVGGTPAAAGDDVRIEVSRGPAPVGVPRVIGLDIVNGEGRLIDSNLVLGVVTFVNRDDMPLGSIISQSPAPNLYVQKGTDVALTVSGGPRVDMAVTAPVIVSGESTTFSVTVFSNEGIPLGPQPTVNMSILSVPGETAGPDPIIVGNEIQTDPTTQGEYQLQADLPDTLESYMTTLVVMPPVSDDEYGGIYSEFSAQIERYDDLIVQLNDAVLTNNLAAIALLDEQLLILADELSVDLIRGTSAMVPEGGIPPDAATAIGLGAVPGAQDEAYLELSISLSESLEDMVTLLSNPLTPDVILFNLNQQILAQAEALGNMEPGLPGVLDAIGPVTDILSYHVPALLAADINVVHQQLVDGGLVPSLKTINQPENPSFTLGGMMSASTIRSTIIRKVYKPLLGNLIRASVILVAGNMLTSYANAGTLVGIITGASLSIHVSDLDNSVIEGFDFEPYAQANTTLFIGPDKIEEAQNILSTRLPTAKDLKDVESIKKAIKKVAGIGNKTVSLVKGAIKSPGYIRRGCLLNSSPLCNQLVFPDGFESAYENDGPLALPAPVLIVTFGMASGNIGVFVGIFLPTKP